MHAIYITLLYNNSLFTFKLIHAVKHIYYIDTINQYTGYLVNMALTLALTRTMLSVPYKADIAEDLDMQCE